ncbi:carcinoembryonic antigen-related cell adhesion molecule 5-like protein [Lates japonicus]|uniref:Carcinoembryonic antigen-related cell adhesion molecule 5-like protein n=1 Tax=Lates japonicus TaxID=270547 RepID=A0AAD3NFF6_LATJO|nr:carcinoembryonic antigen-related cell adhesion molecule 5-like protein [Lates japonicus]
MYLGRQLWPCLRTLPLATAALPSVTVCNGAVVVCKNADQAAVTIAYCSGELPENEGNYICKARNPVTNISLYMTKAFSVTGHASAIHFPCRGSLMLIGLFALLFN